MNASPSHQQRGRLATVGLSVMALGCTMPWFSVGPATTLGTATGGVWVLALSVGAAILTIARRFQPDDRLLLGAAVLVVIGVVATVAIALQPPTSMTVSVGPAASLAGALVTLFALAPGVRSAAASLGIRTRREADEATATATASATNDSVGDDEPTRLGGWNRAARIGGWILGGIGIAILVLGFWPISLDGLDATPQPTTSFDDALARFDALRASETDVYPPCESRLMHHGEPTDVVVVLFHGLTNCPRQYVELGDEMFEQGATVLITRAPGHGIGDQEALFGAGALRDLDANQLAGYADEAIDLAVGLGDEVRASGLSMGGVVALWVAQHRAEVSDVVAIAPAMELPVVPNVVSTFFTNLFSRVPTITISHERHIDHDYAAESTNGLAATFALGQAVADRGLESPAVIDDLTVMLNPDDPLVSETDITALMEAWRTAGTDVRITEFDAIGLRHDLIDLGQPNADPDHVYPLVLAELGFEDTWTDSA